MQTITIYPGWLVLYGDIFVYLCFKFVQLTLILMIKSFLFFFWYLLLMLDFTTTWPSWLSSSCIYNYLCNQCVSPLTLWVQTLFMARCTTLCDKVCQWLAPGRWFSLWYTNSNSNSNSLLILNPTKDCHQQQYNQQTYTKHETIKNEK